jgi:hypothetical protein
MGKIPSVMIKIDSHIKKSTIVQQFRYKYSNRSEELIYRLLSFFKIRIEGPRKDVRQHFKSNLLLL